MNTISIALYKLNRLEESLAYITQSIEIALEILPPTDPFRLMVEKTPITVQNRLQTTIENDQ